MCYCMSRAESDRSRLRPRRDRLRGIGVYHRVLGIGTMRMLAWLRAAFLSAGTAACLVGRLRRHHTDPADLHSGTTQDCVGGIPSSLRSSGTLLGWDI